MQRALTIVALVAALCGNAAAADRSGGRTLEMTVDGMVCGFCAQGIEERFRSLDGTADVLVSLEHQLVVVALKPKADISDAEARRLLTEAGYTLKAVKRTQRTLAQIREKLRTS